MEQARRRVNPTTPHRAMARKESQAQFFGSLTQGCAFFQRKRSGRLYIAGDKKYVGFWYVDYIAWLNG